MIKPGHWKELGNYFDGEDLWTVDEVLDTIAVYYDLNASIADYLELQYSTHSSGEKRTKKVVRMDAKSKVNITK